MATEAAGTLVNPVKARMRAGDVALGLGVRLSRSADIVRIAKTTGHDFVFIDVQHSIFNLETIGHMAQTALAIGIAPVVRVRGVDDPDVSMLLDNGVTGIVYPDVNTAEDARKAVNTAKFAPLGHRSVVGGYPYYDFRSVPVADSVQSLNDLTLVVCMIETRQALANIEEIASVDGIDVIHVGSNDLLADMGKPGKFDDSEFLAALDRVFAVAKAHRRFAGCGGNRDVARQAQAIRKGAQFVTTQTDIGFLSEAAAKWTSSVRKAVAGGG